MGVLIDGAWHDGELPQETGASGEFRRADSRFRERITAGSSSGLRPKQAAITSTSRTAVRGRTAP
jgi:glutathionyl-hydroquinone reductase